MDAREPGGQAPSPAGAGVSGTHPHQRDAAGDASTVVINANSDAAHAQLFAQIQANKYSGILTALMEQGARLPIADQELLRQQLALFLRQCTALEASNSLQVALTGTDPLAAEKTAPTSSPASISDRRAEETTADPADDAVLRSISPVNSNNPGGASGSVPNGPLHAVRDRPPAARPPAAKVPLDLARDDANRSMPPQAEETLLSMFAVTDSMSKEQLLALAHVVGCREEQVKSFFARMRGNFRSYLQRTQKKASGMLHCRRQFGFDNVIQLKLA